MPPKETERDAVDPKIREWMLPHIHAEDGYDATLFLRFVEKLYVFPLFKPCLDLILTKTQKNCITFVLPSPAMKRKYASYDGLCETVDVSMYNEVLQKLFRQHKHTITIRQNIPETIIHEMAHAIEKESGLDIGVGFEASLKQDRREKRVGYLNLLQAISEVLDVEIQSYKPSHRLSEWFARYFQFFAMTQEIGGKNAKYDLRISDMTAYFHHTGIWVEKVLFPALKSQTDPRIAEYTKRYQETQKNTENSALWDEKIRPIHTENNAPSWNKHVKSIFDQ